MAGQHAERRRAIEAALLDFHRAPGRHTLALRQPALLFASIRDVLQLAGERSPEEDGPAPAAHVVEAARFFVRAALLQPDADHYALLGLGPGVDAAAIKERYRAMMRLMHPDFATSANQAQWPGDAATRINQAYEVLSSPERRRAYDEELAAPKPAHVAREMASPPPVVRRAPTPRRADSRQVLRQLALGFGALGGLALAGMWLASGERDSLVQRATTKVDKLPSLFGGAAPEPAPAADDKLSAAIARALPAILAPKPAPTPAASASEPTAPSAASVAAAAPAASAPASPLADPAPAPALAPAPVLAASAAAPAPPIVAAASVPVPAPAPTPVAAPAPAPVVAVQAPPPAPPAPAPVRRAAVAAPAGPSMAQVHPIIMQLLQEIESGWGDNLIASLDFGARRTAGAQALARQLDTLCDGVRPVKIAKVDLKGEPRDGALVVTGQVLLQVRDTASPTRRFAIQAEFTQRDGGAVLTRLSPVAAP